MAKTENENLSEIFLNRNESAAKTESEDLSELFLNWNESVAKTKTKFSWRIFSKLE